MSDEPDSIVLRYLRRIDERISTLVVDVHDVKERLGLLEASYASLSRRIDRVAGDVEQIKKRLDIVDA